MTAQKFRMKPVEIEAMQFTGCNVNSSTVYGWVESHIGSTEWKEAPEPLPTSGVTIDPGTGQMVICTLEGMMWVSDGDWIIRGVQGEFYPCKPDIFAATYEPVEVDQ